MIQGAAMFFGGACLPPGTSLLSDLLLATIQRWLHMLYEPLSDPFSPILWPPTAHPTTAKLPIL